MQGTGDRAVVVTEWNRSASIGDKPIQPRRGSPMARVAGGPHSEQRAISSPIGNVVTVQFEVPAVTGNDQPTTGAEVLEQLRVAHQ